VSSSYWFVLRPRWLAATVGVLTLAIVFCGLGWWQWNRAHRYHKVSAATLASLRTARPASEYLHGGSFVSSDQVGQAVTATGGYAAGRQLVVPGMTQGGRAGCYVIAPLLVGGGHAITVNRGWAPDGPACDHPAAPPAGTVTVRGWLAQQQAADTDVSNGQLTGTAPGQVDAIDTATLANLWPYTLDNGYLTAVTELPAGGAGAGVPLAAVPPPPPPKPSFSWDFQNLGYTLQWWLFAAAGLYWWVLVLRREAAKRSGRDADGDEEDGRAPLVPAPREPAPSELSG
jgi:cytochrome oxidase assembly protein ShyY1